MNCTCQNSQDLNNLKQQNDSHWKVIEKQRAIIQDLQKSLLRLTTENETLTKKNKELESFSQTVFSKTGFDGANVPRHLMPLLSANTIEGLLSPTTPTIPPRSPYRINHSHHRSTENAPSFEDTVTTTTTRKTRVQSGSQSSKRPPVLKLTTSNHSSFHNHTNKNVLDTLVLSTKNINISADLDSTSPCSTTSTGSSGIEGTSLVPEPSLSTITVAATIPTIKPHIPTTPTPNQAKPHPVQPSTTPVKDGQPPLHKTLRRQKSSHRERHSKPDTITITTQSKSEPSTPNKARTPRTPRFDPFELLEARKQEHNTMSNNLPTAALTNITAGSKEGYLTKRRKNFGGWKSRYFVLETAGVLFYYNHKDGNLLGAIRLSHSQIGVQDFGSGAYRHAFFILEPRSKDSHQRHIFCAKSDIERNMWIDALQHHTNERCVTEDILNSSFSDDFLLLDSSITIEPSSSTESVNANTTKTTSKSRQQRSIKKQPSLDQIINYLNTSNNNNDSNASHSTRGGAVTDEEDAFKKSKRRFSKKTLWHKKMFGNGTTSNSNYVHELMSPISNNFMYSGVPALNDYEETHGECQVFGIPLEKAVSVSRVCEQYNLPAIVYRCIEYLEGRGALTEEGIYRLSGSASQIKVLKKRFNDVGDVVLLEDQERHDVHAVAGLLKMWLRELPENILTEALLKGFLHCSSSNLIDPEQRAQEVGRLVSLLPLANYTLLRSLCAHLIRVVDHSDENKMTLKNIGIVFSVTLAIPSSTFNLLLMKFDYIFWTDRYDQGQVVSTTENALKAYIDEDKIQQQQQQQQQQQKEEQLSEEGRSSRNSLHYKDFTPKKLLSLEKQLRAVIDEETWAGDDELCLGDEGEGEFGVAYFASRFDANNNKNSRESSEGVK